MTGPANGALLEEIGRIIADIVGEDPNGAYLYAEVTDGMQAPSVFKDHGNRVDDYRVNHALFDALEELWESEPEGKRWRVIHYEINEGRFDARFEFPDQIDMEEHDFDRRERALAARYGEKQIFYLEPENWDSFHDLKEQDLPDE